MFILATHEVWHWHISSGILQSHDKNFRRPTFFLYSMCTQACLTAHIAILCIIWFWDKHGCDNYFGAKTITWRVDIDLALQVHSPTLRMIYLHPSAKCYGWGLRRGWATYQPYTKTKIARGPPMPPHDITTWERDCRDIWKTRHFRITCLFCLFPWCFFWKSFAPAANRDWGTKYWCALGYQVVVNRLNLYRTEIVCSLAYS